MTEELKGEDSQKPDHYVEIGGLNVEPNADVAEPDTQAAQEVKEPDLEDSQSDLKDAPERDYEAEAKLMGWVEDGEKSAKDFVEYGEKHKTMNYAKAQEVKRIEREAQERYDRLHATIKTLATQQRDAVKNQFDQQIERAVEVGDTAEWKRLREMQDAAVKAVPSEETAPVKAQGIDPRIIEWRERTGYDEWDAPRQAYAIAKLDELMKAHPDVEQHALLPAVDAAIQRVFNPQAEPATQARRQPRQITDKGGRATSGATRTKGYNDLPVEAKRAYQELHDYGMVKSKDQYAKAYFAENGQ